MKRHWKLGAILASVAVAGLAVVALASAATTAPGNAGARGACATLTDDPEALAEMQVLRADMREARQAWSEKWGDERWSDEARADLQQLRETHWDKMRALLEKYDIEVPEGAGPGSRAGQGGGMMGGGGQGCGGQGCGGWGAQGGGMMGGGNCY